jgi:3-hydroxyacyl-CoA dehydrogenase
LNTKLTINIPQEISRRAKARAALEGKTLTEIVRQSLEEYGRGLNLLEEADDLRRVKEIEALLEAGEERLYAHEQVWAEIDDLESKGALPD